MLRFRLYSVFICLVLMVGVLSSQTVYWTGAGDGQSWSDADNWDTLSLPGETDTVVLGDPSKTPDQVLNILLDVSGVEIACLQLAGTGNRKLTFSAVGDNVLTLLSSDALEMSESATADAVIDVPLHYVGVGFSFFNESVNALLTFSQPLTSITNTGTDYFKGAGVMRFDVPLATHRNYQVSLPEVIYGFDGAIARSVLPTTGHLRTLFAGNVTCSRALASYIDFDVALFDSGDDDRIVTFLYGATAGTEKTMTIVDSPDGSTGHG